MSQDRVDNLFASESWSAVYTAFTNVSLKAYDFDTIRDALLIYIKQTYPDKYNDFIASSEFVAVLDLVAYLGHSLSYRLDMNTRENFMDLAERKESVLRLAKTLGYNKTRPINSRGFMKITSVRTNEDVYDSNGVSLANRVINWNDANDTEWYENFITVVNSSLNKETKIKNPKATLNISTIEHNIYEVNENPSSKSVVYGFKSNVAGKNRTFEAVRAGFDSESVIEMQPDRTKNFTIINRNDNLGPASDRTGFFVLTKVGKLVSSTYNYTIGMSNRIQTVPTNNISNSDVWVQKIDNTGKIIREVTKVDNDTRETAIYNAIRYGSGDLVSIRTTIDNGIELHFPDGNFGNVAYGNYRVWYRVADNEGYSVDRNTVENASINIPYVGYDGVTYQLTLTLSSTRDFSENFAAETMASVRRIAPRSYYAQDRMVNAQDYNVLPLSLGQNVVKKVKAINTNFSGNSRYFEMDDVTGHHSNVTVNSTDGSMYLDDDNVTLRVQFNKENGNSVNFIRNEISRILKNGSLANLYYINNIKNSNVVLNEVTAPDVFTNTNIEILSTDPKTILIQPSVISETDNDPEPVELLQPGDFIKVRTDNNYDGYWTRIYGANNLGGGISNFRYKITDIIPEEYKNGDNFQIVEIVKGFRTRFEDTEINDIRAKAFIGSNQPSTFQIKYIYESISDRWIWTYHDPDEETQLRPGTDIFITLSYNQGSRAADAEYTIRFQGKKVVFESEGDVKFFYNNNKKIVDVETNLAHQDKIKIDYYDNTFSNVVKRTQETNMILGYSDINNIVEDNGDLKFDLDFGKQTGAPFNLDFAANVELGHIHTTTSYNIVSSSGSILQTYTDFGEGYDTPIGDREDYQLKDITVPISDLVTGGDPVTNEEDDLVDTVEVYFAGYNGTLDWEQNSSSESTTTTMDFNISINNLKGDPSYEYLNRKDNAFVFVKETELPTGITVSSVSNQAPLVSGIVNSWLSASQPTSTSNYFEFVFTEENLHHTYPIENLFWKQFAYKEITFTSTRPLTISTIVVELIVDGSSVKVNNNHLELEYDETTEQYKIIFWTYDPSHASSINIYDTLTNAGNYDTFKVHAVATILMDRGSVDVAEYRSISSYIYDNYSNGGYIDYSKVKLTSSDTLNNPIGIVSIINDYLFLERDSGTDDKFNLNRNNVDNEFKYEIDFATTERPWDNVTITNYGTVITYDRLQNVINKVFVSTSGEKEFKLVSGMSHRNYNTKVENREGTLLRYNWEHYADTDRRIDPSTSNIVDVYVLTADYTRKVEQWKSSGFAGSLPKAPNNYELKKTMEQLRGKEAISDHVSYVPVKFKPLFGSQASQENQAVFKVVKKKGTLFTDSEIKSSVSAVVNEYFKLENWDFGDTFYFSELAAYIHTKLPEYISSVVITPKYSGNQFTKLLSITSEPNEIFMSVTTSADVKIIEDITDIELLGE